MSTHTRARTRRQQRHPASRSKSHQRDQREGKARQKTAWVPVAAPEHPSPERSFGPLQGHEYTHESNQWRRCDGPEEFADYLERQAERRGWYQSQTQRKGQSVEMKRPVATPIEILTTTFSPWLSDWVEGEITDERDPRKKLAELRTKWLEAAQELIGGLRYMLGYAFHADTDDLHFDLALSRQDGNGGRIGAAGLGLVGPWCVGTDRQLRAGAKVNPDKRGQMKRSVANFRHRYGAGAVPLDVALARALDTTADAVLGAELVPYREAYAARVPELERRHAEARLATLDAAREKLLQQANPPPVPEPEPEHKEPEPIRVRQPEPEPPFPSLG